MKTSIVLFTLLILSAVILAQQSNSNVHSHGSHEPPFVGDFNLDRLPALLSSFSSSSSEFHDMHSLGSEILNFSSIGFGLPPLSTRQKRAPEERRVIRCDFSKGPTACYSCNQVRRCYPLNYGTITNCSGFFRYCRYGRCSNTPGALCTTTSTSTSTTAASTTTTTSSPTETTTLSTSAPTTTSTVSTSVASTTSP